MNRYLVKVASMLSDENKQVAKTFAEQTITAAPAHLVGGYVGSVVGKKFGRPGLGATIGTSIAGGAADLVALKHSLHGKVAK